jgi:hypothetical protein
VSRTIFILPSVLWRNWQTVPRLVLRTKLRNRRSDFDAQIIKLQLSVLRHKMENTPPSWFWGSTKKFTTGFKAKPGEIVATDFVAKSEKTIATGFEAKSKKTVSIVLRPNHWQTIDHGFEAQPRNPHSSFSRAQCRPHTSSPDLSIIRPPSIQPVWSWSVICTRSSTPAMILVAACHAAPATYTLWDKQAWFSTGYKDEDKTMKYLGFEFKHRQVNDSLQSK